MSQPSLPQTTPTDDEARETTANARKGSEKIPPITGLAVSSFVPFDDDPTLPVDPPADRVERLKKILHSIELQRVGVRENLIYIFKREKARIVMEAQEQEGQQGILHSNPVMSPEETDWLINNMEQPADPNIEYNLTVIPPLDMNRTLPADITLRERALEDVLTVVERLVDQLAGYERHMASIKAEYLNRLEKEIARMEDVGKRPEERQ